MTGREAADMITTAKRITGWEKRRLYKRTEKCKSRCKVSASLFLESEMNALPEADCFFFSGSRFAPKGMLSVFFPDEKTAEITVAEFTRGGGRVRELFETALRECRRVNVENIYTVVDPSFGFTVPDLCDVGFTYAWSEYMLRMDINALARAADMYVVPDTELVREPHGKEDGTERFCLMKHGCKAAECLILPLEGGKGCYLFDLKTEADFLRQGMATGLITEIGREFAHRNGTSMKLQVSSENRPALALYRKLGFETAEERMYYKTEEI